jgi:hypothetical protein
MPEKKLSHAELPGSNPQDFIKHAQSRNVFHLEAVKIFVV